MRIIRIPNPELSAEGLCNGLAYTTDTYNSQGCSIHFWLGDGLDVSPKQLTDALNKARNARDIVKATWSFGAPKYFWAHQNID